ncbi:MAG: helix-turn-helix domain-containing protein [Chloroflexota bacterium]
MTAIDHETRNYEKSHVVEGLDLQEMSGSDMQATPVPSLDTSRETAFDSPLEMHYHHLSHNHMHIDLMQDEYIPEEVARMFGTSLETVLHSIRIGDLKAKRKGQHVVSFPRAALIHWYENRR